jgi:hypothetical protein
METTFEPRHHNRNPGISLSRLATTRALIAVLLLFFATNSLLVSALQVSRLPLLTDAGYGDSYIFYDILHFQKTGVIYRNLSQPPYLPAQYSPLLYMLYSVPARINSSNPFIGPRLLALAIFILCIAVVVSIVRVLVPVRHAWLWGLLLASSFRSMELWPLQLRGDFPGILFGLTSIRLLLARSSRAVLFAGLCAGLATQFKFTYVAALAAGSLWLLLRKQWRNLAIFLGTGVLTSIGLYLVLGLLEPHMFSQMLTLAPGIRDVRGCVKLAFDAIKEPTVLLALLPLPLVVLRRWPRWMLLLLYVCLSFAIGGLTDIQAGGSINYFFEFFFALTPLAVFGIYELIAWSRPYSGVAVFTTALFLIHFFPSSVRDNRYPWNGMTPSSIRSQNATFRRFAAAMRGRHIFSTVPRIALLDPQPALVEPYLLTYMQRLGKFDGQPILSRVRDGEFDVVVTAADRTLSWRGVPHIDKALEASIASAYKLRCSIGGYLVYLPGVRPANGSLMTDLGRAGCVSPN